MARKKTLFENDDIRVDEELLIADVLNAFDDSKEARSVRDNKWKSYFDRYHGILPVKEDPWIGCANLFIPATPIVIDTFWANLNASFVNRNDMVKVLPVSANDVTVAEKRTSFLNWQLTNEIKIKSVSDKIFEIMLVYGDAFVKVRYDRVVQSIKVPEIQQIEQEDGTIVEEKVMRDVEQVFFDGIVLDVPNIDDIYKAPNSVGTQRNTCEYMIEKVRKSRSEYEGLVSDAGYRKIDFNVFKGRTDDIEEDTIKRLGLNFQGINHELHDDKNYVMLIEYHGEYFNEKMDKVQEMVVIVHPTSRTIVKAFLNIKGVRPYVQFTPFPIANMPYGRAIPEILESLQDELNTIHNQRVDSATKRISQPGFYNKGTDFDPGQHSLNPNSWYPIDDVRNIFVPNYQDAPGSQFREEELIWRYIEQLMSVDKTTQGVQTAGEKTATEIASLSNRANTRFNLVYDRMESSFIDLMDIVVIENKENMPPEKEFRVLGADGRFKHIPITQEEFNGKFDLILTASSSANESAEIQKTLNAYQLVLTNPLTGNNPFALYEALKAALKKLGVENIDRWVPAPPQVRARTPQEEHDLLMQGQMVYPDQREDAQSHVLEHLGYSSQPEFHQTVDPQIQKMFAMHIQMSNNLAAAQGTMNNVKAGIQPPGAEEAQAREAKQAQPQQQPQG